MKNSWKALFLIIPLLLSGCFFSEEVPKEEKEENQILEVMPEQEEEKAYSVEKSMIFDPEDPALFPDEFPDGIPR